MRIEIKRIYAPAEEADGRRVLVDRLWPRGVSKRDARLDEWLKDAAPSPGLRAWFGHREENFERFSEMYRFELDADAAKQSAVRHLLELARAGKLTLLYAARSETVNHAAVLRGVLEERIGDL
ncbi:MAG: DUF488 family protein [Clostridiales bacterium]|nr:DUF488 family protein [Clostridiales bacterium]